MSIDAKKYLVKFNNKSDTLSKLGTEKTKNYTLTSQMISIGNSE